MHAAWTRQSGPLCEQGLGGIRRTRNDPAAIVFSRFGGFRVVGEIGDGDNDRTQAEEVPLLLDEVAAAPAGYGGAEKSDESGGGSDDDNDAALGFCEALRIPNVVQYAVAYAFIKCINYVRGRIPVL